MFDQELSSGRPITRQMDGAAARLRTSLNYNYLIIVLVLRHNLPAKCVTVRRMRCVPNRFFLKRDRETAGLKRS